MMNNTENTTNISKKVLLLRLCRFILIRIILNCKRVSSVNVVQRGTYEFSIA